MLKLFSPFAFINFCICYWSGAASIAGSVVSGALSSSSSAKASKSAKKANALNQQQIAQQKVENNASFAPYKKIGEGANNILADRLGIDMGLGSTPGKAAFNPLGYSDWAKSQGGGNSSGLTKAQSDYLAFHFSPSMGYMSGNPFRTNSSDTSQSAYDQYLRDHPATAATAATTGQHSDQFGSLLKSFDQNDLNNDTVYNSGLQFGLDEGTKAIDRLSASRGGTDSGATLKALTRYANDYGTTKAEGAYGRFNQDKNTVYNYLSGQQNVGLNATNNNSSLNNNLLTQSNAGNSNTAQQVGQNTINSAAGINNGFQSGLGNILYNQQMNNQQNNNQPVLSGGYSTTMPGYGSQKPWYLS